MNFASGGRGSSPHDEPEPTPGLTEGEEGVDDVTLMLRVRDGDLEAFEALVTRHQHSVVGTAAKMLGGGADAEDIAQQVFVRVWKSAARYEPSAKFTTWLMTITRNLVFNELRRRRRTHQVSMDADAEDSMKHQFVDEEAPVPSEQLLDTELQDAIDAAIASLPENQRLAIVLRRFEGMPYEDIARVLGDQRPGGQEHPLQSPGGAEGETKEISRLIGGLSVAGSQTSFAVMGGFRKVGLTTCTALALANMIGTGVFTSLGFQVEAIPSPFLILLLWVLGGVIALVRGAELCGAGGGLAALWRRVQFSLADLSSGARIHGRLRFGHGRILRPDRSCGHCAGEVSRGGRAGIVGQLDVSFGGAVAGGSAFLDRAGQREFSGAHYCFEGRLDCRFHWIRGRTGWVVEVFAARRRSRLDL